MNPFPLLFKNANMLVDVVVPLAEADISVNVCNFKVDMV